MIIWYKGMRGQRNSRCKGKLGFQVGFFYFGENALGNLVGKAPHLQSAWAGVTVRRR